MKLKKVRKDIVKYLKKQGYVRLTEKEYALRFAEMKAIDYSFEDRHNQAADNPIITPPDIYEFQQSHEAWYDHRVNFLEKIVNIFHPMKNRNLTVMESGCATAIDLVYLARIFPNFNFKGFDIQEGMVDKAKKRISELDIKNIEVYCSDNKYPKENELESADILYNNASLISENIPREEQVKSALSLCQRVKPNGMFIMFGVYMENPVEVFHKGLKKHNIRHIKTENYHRDAIAALSYKVNKQNMAVSI